MQSSRSNWKQAVRKDNPVESRIFGVNRELPNKFSPARYSNNQNTSKSLIKNRSNNYSHDEYAIAASMAQSRERSSSREPKLERKGTMKTLQSAEPEEESVGKPRLQSFKSIDLEMQKQSFKSNAKAEDLDIVRELKLEFIRFKERVLKELRRQEQEVKATIQQIYDRVGNLQNCTESPIQFRSSPVSLKLNSISLSSPKFEAMQSPISKYLELLNKQAPDSVAPEGAIRGGKKGESVANIIQQSFTPQIKERMNKFEELLSSLKQELNHQLPIDRSPSSQNFISNDA